MVASPPGVIPGEVLGELIDDGGIVRHQIVDDLGLGHNVGGVLGRE